MSSYGPVVVAVSGGADSLTLLHIVRQLPRRFPSPHVVTFDHGIRGAAGAEDVAFVREIAAQWEVPVTAGAADVPALAHEWHMGIEEAARKARYDFLREVTINLRAQMILTGHNQDDQAETVLLHLIRGAGLAGLRGIMPMSHVPNYRWIPPHLVLGRPLLGTSRAEIDEYVRALGIQPRVDATNADVHYTRNRLRHEIMPLLAEINPQVRSALARTAETLTEDYAALRFVNIPFRASVSGYSADRELFLALPVSQRKIVIHEIAQVIAPELMITHERIEAALQAAVTGSGKIQLGGDLWFVSTPTDVSIRTVSTLPYLPDCPSLPAGAFIAIENAGTYLLPESNWQLTVERIKPDSAVNPLSVILAIEEGQRISLRTRYRGDRFKPSGLNGHSQKIKETLINIKIAAEWRDNLPLLVVGDEIAWIVAPTQHGPIQHMSHTFTPKPADSRPLWRFTFVQTVHEVTS